MTGPEGRFAHELVVPFVLTEKPERAPEPEPPPPAPPGFRRRLGPGSGCLYARLYVKPRAQDAVIEETLAPLAEGLCGSGIGRRWFFMRYADPLPHVRWRVFGAPARLWLQGVKALHAAAGPLLDDGRLASLAASSCRDHAGGAAPTSRQALLLDDETRSESCLPWRSEAAAHSPR